MSVIENSTTDASGALEILSRGSRVEWIKIFLNANSIKFIR